MMGNRPTKRGRLIFLNTLVLIAALDLTTFFFCHGLQSPSFTSVPVERMSPEEYIRQRQKPDGAIALDYPILIPNVLSLDECEIICNTIMSTVGEESIAVQRTTTTSTAQTHSTTLHECTVLQALDLMMKSCPKDARFAFVEGLLESNINNNNNHALENIHQQLIQVRENLFVNDQPNWMDYFPTNLKPQDCVVLAGQGAMSTLHRDPFEWTGTSICLEGRKLWRFLSPTISTVVSSDDQSKKYVKKNNDVKQWDTILKSYRLSSTAWQNICISAGWQSDFTLYDTTNIPPQTLLPSARDLAEMSQKESNNLLHDLVLSVSNCWSPPLSPPLMFPKDDNIENISSVEYEFHGVVQQPGDLLLIPPYWYHQTYGPEPSMAIASQRCGTALDAPRVLRHILDLVINDEQSNHDDETSSTTKHFVHRAKHALPERFQYLLQHSENGSHTGIDVSSWDPKETIQELAEYLKHI